MAVRLPTVGGDDGNWGQILNDFLSTTHKADGTLKDNSVSTSTIADGSVTLQKTSTTIQASLTKADTSLQTVDKTSVGLNNVDNTSDLNKPVSTATQTALNAKVTSVVGQTGIITGAQIAADAALTSTYGRPYLPGGFISGSPGVRRAQFAWGGSGDTINSIGGLTDAHERLPVILPVDTTRWRLRIRNAKADGTNVAGTFNVNGVWMGKGANNSTTGAPTGAFTASPAAVLGAFTTASDGASDTVTSWVTDPTMQFSPNQLHLVSLGWTTTATQIARGTGVIFYSAGAGRSADASAISPSLSIASNIQLYVALEYEFSGSNRIGIVIGDSLTEGYGSNTNTIYSMKTWHQLYSQRVGIPMCMSAAYGSQASAWAVTTDWRYQRWVVAGLNIDFAIVELGSNDASSSVALATYQSRMAAIFTALRSLGIQDIHATTVAPRALTATPEAIRVSYNSWLKSRPFDLLSVPDVAEAIQDPTTAANLRADYQLGGDTTHWSKDGHHVVARTIQNI